MFEEKTKQFIRWYYGEFVIDPRAETFTFGLHRPAGARRLTRVLHLIQYHWMWVVGLVIGFVGAVCWL